MDEIKFKYEKTEFNLGDFEAWMLRENKTLVTNLGLIEATRAALRLLALDQWKRYRQEQKAALADVALAVDDDKPTEAAAK